MSRSLRSRPRAGRGGGRRGGSMRKVGLTCAAGARGLCTPGVAGRACRLPTTRLPRPASRRLQQPQVRREDRNRFLLVPDQLQCNRKNIPHASNQTVMHIYKCSIKSFPRNRPQYRVQASRPSCSGMFDIGVGELRQQPKW